MAIALSLFVYTFSIFSQAASADGLTTTSNDLNSIGNNTPFYDPTSGGCSASTTTTTPSTPNLTIDNTAATQAAKQASTGGTNVGYALYDSAGNNLASYNDTFENYGASITKSMILVAYLNQVGSGTISASAKDNITGMIEQSNDTDSNNVFKLLTDPKNEIEAVAQKVGMTGFNYNDTADSLYILGQSQITAQDFAMFFSKIDTMFPANQKDFALKLLSNIAPQVGLLQANLPGTVYSKEGWKPEPGNVDDHSISGTTDPFGQEGAPYVVNQAAQFSSGNKTYGIAVTVAGAQGSTQAEQESNGEAIIKSVASALVNQTTSANSGSVDACSCNGGPVSVTAGTGSPEGTTFPNLNPDSMVSAINTFIDNNSTNSPLSGLGSTIVASAKQSNINPFLVPTIALAETSIGTVDTPEVTQANNIFDRSATSTQPNISLSGKFWYKWSSVKNSVDYTAPENQNAQGGGDFTAYVASEFSTQINNNDLVGLIEAYAPPGQNNTAQYIANVKSWVKQLVQLASGGTVLVANTTTSASILTASDNCGTAVSVNCSDSQAGLSGTVTGDAAILCEAEKYQGIYYAAGYSHSGYSVFRQACPEASISGAVASSSAADPGPCATDCSGLVSVAVDAVFNQSYDWVVSNSNGQMTGDGSQYWKSIPISQAQPGDIVTSNSGDGTRPAGTDGHVEIVVKVEGDTVYTFGSHGTGIQTGPVSSPQSGWDEGAWEWTGPGSGVNGS